MTQEQQIFEVVLSIGSNCGDREAQVSAGIFWLKNILDDFKHSRIYTTGDCHGGKRDYMNTVVKGRTSLSAEVLNNLCKEYEKANGRTAEARSCGDVPVDIDIVIYAGEIIRPKDYRQKFFQIGFSELMSQE